MAHRRNARSSTVRPTFWSGSVSTAFATLTSATPLIATLVSEAGLENVPNPTLMRTRGAVTVSLNQGNVINEAFSVAVGIAVIGARAFAAGTASVPLPLTDSGNDKWLWWGHATINSGIVGSGTVDSSLYCPCVRLDVDSKAMRKIQADEVIMIAFEVDDLVAAAARQIDVSFGLRMLLKR